MGLPPNPNPYEQFIIGQTPLDSQMRDMETEALKTQRLMLDAKDVIKAALFEVLAEVFKK